MFKRMMQCVKTRKRIRVRKRKVSVREDVHLVEKYVQRKKDAVAAARQVQTERRRENLRQGTPDEPA